MTLAERLVAIQAEYESACAEAAYLRRLAASKARLTPVTIQSAESEPAETIARLRDRADAISERASELKLQIAEIENHFLESGETPDAGAAKQFRELQDRLALLRHREHAEPKGFEEGSPLEEELRLLQTEYLRTRAAELAKTYLGLAHQLMDAATQIRALSGVAEQESGTALLRLDNLEIPLPRDHGSVENLEDGPLSLDNERVREIQQSLRAHLSTLLKC